MMISPETYYEMELAGKSIRELKKMISSLQQEMDHLVKTIEMPGYRPMMRPDERTRLSCVREYLAKAKEALNKAGGKYTPTKEEAKAERFDANIPHIQKIVYSASSFFGSSYTHAIDLTGCAPCLTVDLWPFAKPEGDAMPIELDMTKEEFWLALRDIHIGEWQNRYHPERYGYHVCDGTQWELSIFYDNGEKEFFIEGDNTWPYNFDEFSRLMGIDPEEEEDEDEE